MTGEKLTAQDEVTSAADTDIVYIVVDVLGTPTSKKIQIVNLRTRTLESLSDVPAYPNDGNDYVLVNNNLVLTWELSGASGFIPLSGTTVGNPVTGDIEFTEGGVIAEKVTVVQSIGDEYKVVGASFEDGDWSGSIGIITEPGEEAKPEFSRFNISTGEQYLFTLELWRAERALGNTDISLRLLDILIQGSATGFKGLEGGDYYGANYTDNTYVQKKYVDETQQLQLGAAYSDEDITDLTESTSVPVWSKYIGIAFTLTDWLFDVVTVPTGGAITLDVHKNGTTIFSTKPTIAISANTSTGAVISVPAFAVGDLCEVFIDVVGTTTTGRGLKGDPIGTLI